MEMINVVKCKEINSDTLYFFFRTLLTQTAMNAENEVCWRLNESKIGRSEFRKSFSKRTCKYSPSHRDTLKH